MLYKKYHRNYIRQFKEGTRFKYNYKCYTYTVIKEPYYSTYYQHIEFQSTSIIPVWTLIYPSGFINYDIKIVGENAV